MSNLANGELVERGAAVGSGGWLEKPLKVLTFKGVGEA